MAYERDKYEKTGLIGEENTEEDI
jgi:hypothetical protein